MKALHDGYTARNATLADLEPATALMNEFSQHYLDTDNATPEAIRKEWLSPGFEPGKDILLVFAPDGQMAGYIEVWTTSKPPVHPWVWWCVHPRHQDNGLGLHLLDWAEGRARQVLPEVPAELRVAMWSGANNQIEYSQQTLAAHGMRRIRHNFRMLIELDAAPAAPQIPAGIEFRTFDPDRDDPAEIYRADTDAFRDHFGFIEQPFETGFQRFKHFFLDDEEFDPSLWILAVDTSQPGDRLAGICLCRKAAYEDPQCGWVSTLGVRREYRQRGIGGALLQQSFQALYQRGQRKVGLGVDGENLTGALRLYEKAGMHVDRRYDMYEKELRPGQEISVQSL